MRRTFFALALSAVASLAIADAARAGNYDESIDGDLSGVPASPTEWTLAGGANILTGRAGNSFPEPDDYDLVAFTVPVGYKLDTISIVSFTVEDNLAFLGLQEGSPWDDGLGWEISGGNLIGWALLDTNPADVDDLIEIMLPNGNNPERTGPLTAGVYTMVLQDVDDYCDYSLSFNVSAAATAIAGDFDGNKIVDADDLLQWRGDYGLNADSNADGDTDTDGNDFLVWQQNLGTSAAISAVPEPAGAVLAALGFAALLRRRRAASPRG